jgi:hypothetical protein
MSEPDDEDGRPRPYPRPQLPGEPEERYDGEGVDDIDGDHDEGRRSLYIPAPQARPWDKDFTPYYAQPPEPENDPTPYPQIVAPPSWFKRQVYSLWFYIAVMSGISAGVWWAWLKINSPEPLKNVVIGITVVAALMCLLRLVRGSVLDAEEKFEEALRKKAENAKNASAGGFPVLEVVSNRIGQALDRTPGKPPERVVWEGTQQFFCVFSIAARRFTKSELHTKLTKWYFILLVGSIAASIFYSRQGDPAGVVGRINSFVGLLSLVLVAYVAFGLWEWRVNRYAITDKRLMGVTGILSKDVGSMPNNRFTDAKISVSLTARVFEWFRIVPLAWATWNVESAGQDQALKLIRFIIAGHIIGPFYSLGDTR